MELRWRIQTALSQLPFRIRHTFVCTFFLTKTDPITYQNIDLSSWITVYIKFNMNSSLDNVKGSQCAVSKGNKNKWYHNHEICGTEVLSITQSLNLDFKYKIPYFPAHKTHFLPRKMWPKFNLRLNVPRVSKMTFYMKKVTHRVKTTMKMILVAVTTILWVSVMNKVYYGC
jgi:hypothetical protein